MYKVVNTVDRYNNSQTERLGKDSNWLESQKNVNPMFRVGLQKSNLRFEKYNQLFITPWSVFLKPRFSEDYFSKPRL